MLLITILKHRELSSMLCDDLGEWDWVGEVEGRSKKEEIYIYKQPIHFIVQQKLTKQRKAIILQ